MNKSLKQGLVQFWLNPKNEQDQRRLQIINEWKQNEDLSFVDKMRKLLDRAEQPLEIEQRIHHIETLLQQIYDRIISGETIISSEIKTQQSTLVNMHDVNQMGV